MAQLMPPPSIDPVIPPSPEPSQFSSATKSQSQSPDSIDQPLKNVFQTESNVFGVFRRYYRHPDEQTTPDLLCDSPSIATHTADPPPSPAQSFGQAAVASVLDASCP